MNTQNLAQDNQTNTLPQDYQSLLEKMKEKVSQENNPSGGSITTPQKQVEEKIKQNQKNKEPQIPEPPISWPAVQSYANTAANQNDLEIQQTPSPTNQKAETQKTETPEQQTPQNFEQPEVEKEPQEVFESYEMPSINLNPQNSAEARELAETLTENLKIIESLLSNKELIEKELEALQNKKLELDKEIEAKRSQIAELTQKIHQLIG